MKYIQLILSALATNCYIVPVGEPTDFNTSMTDENGNTTVQVVQRRPAAVIDPADDAEEILSEAAAAGMQIKYILLTHGHFDHTGAASAVKAKTGAEIYIHSQDKAMLTDSVTSLAFFTPERPFVPCTADHLLSGGESLHIGDLTFTVLHTPGHTAGSVCFLCGDPDGGKKLMFAGDTLFKDSVGRSDVYSSDRSAQQDSLDKLAALTDDYIVLPGHGDSTTLSAEKRYNPFLAGL